MMSGEYWIENDVKWSNHGLIWDTTVELFGATQKIQEPHSNQYSRSASRYWARQQESYLPGHEMRS
jgi:hypothetical protein